MKTNDVADGSGVHTGMRDIERALASLGEDQRSALLLVTLEGLSYRETAEVQGVAIGTVMSRLARARAQIKGVSRRRTTHAAASEVSISNER